MYGQVKKAIKHISAKERKVIFLYFIKELKLAEISSLLKIPISTVHKIKEKAIKDIKRILGIKEKF